MEEDLNFAEEFTVVGKGYSLSGKEVFDLVEEPKIKRIPKRTLGKYVDILSDVGFKLVFGKEANKEIIIEFLNQVIRERQIVDFEYLDKEQYGRFVGSKESIYDLYCKGSDGSRIIVEVQRQRQDDFVDRSIYYMTHPIQDQVLRGSSSYSFCPVYLISILDFCLPQLQNIDSVRSHFVLREKERGDELTDRYNIIYLELPKFNKSLEEIKGDILEGFYYCFRHMQSLDERPLSMQQKVFKMLFKAAQVSRMTEVEQNKYLKVMTTERDIRNQIATARREGREEGREEGRVNYIKNLICFNLKTMGVEQVAAFLGMNNEEVIKIADVVQGSPGIKDDRS